jgi:hypothetical protein
MRLLSLALFAVCAFPVAAMAQTDASPATPPPPATQVQTTLVPTQPALPDDDKPPRDDSPVICRPGQKQTTSRLLPPPVCKTQRQWDDLHARGLELMDDGKTTYHTSQKNNSGEMRICRNAGDCPP